MAHKVVKFLTTDDGDEVTNDDWHFVMEQDAERALCTGEVFGYGESAATYKDKTVASGGITCPACKKLLKEIKAVKL